MAITMLRTLVSVVVKEIGDRTLEFAGSTEDVDRMGDIIKSSGWKLGPFKKNPVFMWVHDYSQPPIGRALKVWVDKETKRLMFNVQFAGPDIYQFADTIYKLYLGGFLHATSVGFIPLNWEGKDGENDFPAWEGNVFTSQELLELSSVPVPANANALMSARDSGLITVKEFDAVVRADVLRVENLDVALQQIKAEGKDPFYTGGAIKLSEPEPTKRAVSIAAAQDGQHDDHTIQTLVVDEEAATTYECECVDCGHKVETEKHCADIECPKCGGKMRRAERPGPGKEALPRTVPQEQLIDDVEYLAKVIEENGLSAKAWPKALGLAADIIKRYTGNDIPDEILTKVGAVLNAKNKGRLTQIQELAQAVLDSAQAADEGDKHLAEPTVPAPSPETLQKERAQEVAEVAQAVIALLKGKRTPK